MSNAPSRRKKNGVGRRPGRKRNVPAKRNQRGVGGTGTSRVKRTTGGIDPARGPRGVVRGRLGGARSHLGVLVWMCVIMIGKDGGGCCMTGVARGRHLCVVCLGVIPLMLGSVGLYLGIGNGIGRHAV